MAHAATFGNGQDPESDHPLNIDVEKAAHWDLVERQEFAEKVADMKSQFDKQEKQKAKKEAAEKAAKEKEQFEARVQSEVEKRAQGRKDPNEK